MPYSIRGRGHVLPCLSAIVLSVLVVGGASANPEVYQKTLRSTGWVLVPRDTSESALGTCWLVDREQRLAVTCQHLVGDAHEVLVYFPCRKKGEVEAEAAYYLKNVPVVVGQVIATDAARDLALIRLKSVPDGVVPLSLASHSARPGEAVHSIGNPDLKGGLAQGTLWWYTRGQVRQVHRQRVSKDGPAKYVRLLESQSPVNAGDSGGPVVNDQCQLVGVARSYKSDQRLVSESVDVSEVKSFLASAKKKAAEETGELSASLVGNWQFTPEEEDGEQECGRAEFKDDGTFTLAEPGKKEAKKGRYAYANGVLWLISEKGYVCVGLKWADKDRFSFHATEPRLMFSRQEEVGER
jgi:S1-C subfamily serine protease